MRRIALVAALIAAGIAWVASVAGADDVHTYKIELDNAFGIVEGSEVRVAGVTQGEVKDLDTNPAKRAVLTVEVSGPLSRFGEQTTCSSEPQSLIAESFLDCVPTGDPLPEGGTIPVDQTTTTVQPDLVNNTLREPYKRRLQLLINEFGTALAGNPENLNAAIRRGAPALRELRGVLDILGDQNRIIRQLNEDSDRIIGLLAERRGDVVKFVQEARDTAAASAERRTDLARDFNLLDDFLAELRPTMARLGDLAREQTPLLADLRLAAPELNRLALNLPAFNDASRVSLESLGDAAVVGERALRKGRDEIRALRSSGRNARSVADVLADFLRDLDDPRRAVEIDERVEEDTGRTSTKPGTKNTMGWTGLEGLLNYVYYQTGAINQFDQISHLLHFSLYEFESTPCGEFTSGRHEQPDGSVEIGVPSAEGGEDEPTTDILEANRCVAWLGPNQPDLSFDLNLPPYDPSVCNEGSAVPELCNPSGSSGRRARSASTGGTPTTRHTAPPTAGEPAPGAAPLTPSPLPGTDDATKALEDLLGLPEGKGLPELPGNGGIGGDQRATENLLDFLFGP